MRGGWLAVALVLSSGSMAHAQEDARWDRAVRLRAQGRDAEALDLFQQIHRDSGSARSLAQVALAEQALGRWSDAREHLDTALASPDDWIERNRATLEQARAEIARHAAHAPAPPTGGGSPLAMVGGILLGVAAAAAVVSIATAIMYEGVVCAGRF